MGFIYYKNNPLMKDIFSDVLKEIGNDRIKGSLETKDFCFFDIEDDVSMIHEESEKTSPDNS